MGIIYTRRKVNFYMLKITDSDIYRMQDSTGVLTAKISNVLKKGMSGFMGDDIIILNGLLDDSLQGLRRLYNEPIILDILNAVKDGTILLVSLSLEYSIPKCMPFIKYAGQDKRAKMLVNLTPYVVTRQSTMGDKIYSISAQRLYPILVSAYLTLTRFDGTYMPPSKAIDIGAYLWANMYNKILCKTVALGTNKERYDAFMYLAMKFFCINILQTPEQIAEDVARGYLLKKGRKDFPLLNDILQKIQIKNANIYLSFTTFCKTLFDNEITNLRVNSQRSEATINTELFLNRFVDQYKYESLFALGSFPYFLFAIMNATLKTRVVNDMAFQDIISDKNYNVYQFINSVLQ